MNNYGRRNVKMGRGFGEVKELEVKCNNYKHNQSTSLKRISESIGGKYSYEMCMRERSGWRVKE